MELIRVNLTLSQEVWGQFSILVPMRKKSKIINELLKKEVEKITRRKEEQTLASAFEEASKDKGRQKILKDWELLDAEGWD